MRPSVLVASAALLAIVPARAAAADEDKGLRGDAAVYFRGATDVAKERQLLTLDLDTRVLAALVANRLGPAASADFQLGAARLGPRAALAYGLHVAPLGLGVAFGETSSLVVTIGAGFGGVTGALPFDLELPVSGRLAIDLTERARLELDARVLFTPDARDANRAWAGDEARVGLGARFGRTWAEHDMRDAGGYFFRLARVERMGTTFLGLALGYELGGAM